jgi:hypothetical protein
MLVEDEALRGISKVRLTAASSAGPATFGVNCAFRSICLNGIAASCAKHAHPPVAITKPSIAQCTAFMSTSGRLAFAAGGVID